MPDRAPQHIPGFRRDGSADQRGLNEHLVDRVIDHVETGAISADGVVVTRLYFRGGGSVLIYPRAVREGSPAWTAGGRWTCTFVVHPGQRRKPGIIVPGVGAARLERG